MTRPKDIPEDVWEIAREIVDVAARNPNVLEYMRHWEGRAETAEAALAASDARIAELEAEVERLRALVQPAPPHPTDGGWIPWEGGGEPNVSSTASYVEIKTQDGDQFRINWPDEDSDRWELWGHPDDIAFYRVVQP